MKQSLIAAAVVLLNVTVAFATDGQWKTAGLGLMTAYWRLNRISPSNRQENVMS